MTTTLPGSSEGVSGDEPAVQPLLAPREGVPPVVTSADALAEVVARFAAGTGPTAVDAERASGYRYSQRAYLVQLRRAGAGTALVDPLGCPDLSELSDAIAGDEWVLHAASQDLACLAEVGLVPARVFDTELAGRLAGFERVGLGAMVEKVLGLRLEKGHSAADWSTRPLPESWLVYAALDVEVLVELRDRLEQVLREQGKLELAAEEFDAVRLAPAPAPRVDPWRRTSGIHRMRNRRQLAAVRALWETRDAMARRRDVAPGRILPDAAIVAAVQADPQTPAALLALPVFGGRSTRRHVDTWFGALQAARALPEAELPLPLPVGDGPPQANRWAERDPVAARRLVRVRAVVTALADELQMPPENLVQPEAVRRLAWTPPDPVSEQTVTAALRASGAREWQVLRVAGPLAAALPEPPSDEPRARSRRPTRPVADPVLRTEHLVLHPLTPALARAVLEGDTEHALALGFPRPDDRTLLEGVLAAGAPSSGSWLVARDGALIGSAGAAGAVTPDGDQELGYGLVPAARGAGTGTEAVAAVAAVLERRQGVRRLTAEVLPGNVASVRLLTRLGFVEVDGGSPPHVRLARAAPGSPAVRPRIAGRHVC